MNRLLWMKSYFSVSPQDKILQKTPYSFDVSVWEFFLPLISGAQMILVPPQSHRELFYIGQVIKQQEVSMVHFVPPMLNLFLEQQLYVLPPVSFLVTSFCGFVNSRTIFFWSLLVRKERTYTWLEKRCQVCVVWFVLVKLFLSR